MRWPDHDDNQSGIIARLCPSEGPGRGEGGGATTDIFYISTCPGTGCHTAGGNHAVHLHVPARPLVSKVSNQQEIHPFIPISH